jgi:hypothetical protein
MMPPLYYINPFLAQGRENEYLTVDSGLGSPQILGTSSNRLESSLGVDTALNTSVWYLPSRTSVSVKSITGRQDQGYSQLRSAKLSIGKDVLLHQSSDGSSGLVSINGGYEIAKDYSSSLAGHDAFLNGFLQRTYSNKRQMRVDATVTYERRRQHLGDPRFLLFPNNPSAEPEKAVRRSSDSLRGSTSVEYQWNRRAKPRLSPNIALDDLEWVEAHIHHMEKITVEGLLLLRDSASITYSSSTPLKIVFEHTSELPATANLSFHLGVRTLGGVEERIENGIRTYLPSWGAEVSLEAALRY